MLTIHEPSDRAKYSNEITYLWNKLYGFNPSTTYCSLSSRFKSLVLYVSAHHNPCFHSYHLSLLLHFTSD